MTHTYCMASRCALAAACARHAGDSDGDRAGRSHADFSEALARGSDGAPGCPFFTDRSDAVDARPLPGGLVHEPPGAAVLREPIVGAFGLQGDQPFVSIRGDPSLRETVPLRPRQKSRLDHVAGQVLETCAELLRNTGVYAIYVGFNSSEVRTESIFNPFSYEVHDAEDLVKPGYTARHFVTVPYAEKMRTVAWVRATLQTGPLRRYLPPHWLTLMDAERTNWRPLAQDRIDAIVQGFNTLRGIEAYYLRNAAISLPEGVVRASYNCDGTYIVRAEYFPEFVRINTP